MKLYRVITERDSHVYINDSGKGVTEILRKEHRYTADSIQDVWDAVEWLRTDPEVTIIAIIEDAPLVTVVQRNQQEELIKESHSET